MSETLEPALPRELDERAEQLMHALCDRGWSVSTAESCTGGMLAALLTDIEGASHGFDRGFVAYTKDAKTDLLGIDPDLLDRNDAVSEAVARAMATGALERSSAEIAIGVTGFAGPAEDGCEEGLVHFALAKRDGPVRHRVEHFGSAGRGPVRIMALRAMLEMLEESLDERRRAPSAAREPPLGRASMADIIFYTNPQSRGRIARWMLEEVGEPYETEIVPYEKMKDADYLAVNPMGKVPAIRHNGQVVTECAAICAYLADVFPDAGLCPRDEEKASYYRWLFYAAGPVEQAITNKAAGWEPDDGKQRMFGYGSYDRVVAVLDELFSLSEYVCGDRFTAADVYLGAHIMWGMQFGTLPERDSFKRYVERLTSREAFKRGWAKDDEAQSQIQPAQPQPA